MVHEETRGFGLEAENRLFTRICLCELRSPARPYCSVEIDRVGKDARGIIFQMDFERVANPGSHKGARDFSAKGPELIACIVVEAPRQFDDVQVHPNNLRRTSMYRW